MNDGDVFCPYCAMMGRQVPLLHVNSAVGIIKGVCSSIHCSYPFTSYRSLKSSISVQNHNSVVDDSDSVRDFLEELFEMASDKEKTEQHLCSSNEGDLQPVKTSNAFHMNCESISEGHLDLPGVSAASCSTNCLLPRYLADDMKRCESNLSLPHSFINEDLNHSVHSGRFSNSAYNGKTNSSDSGVSISSLSSQTPTPLSYGDYVTHRGSLNIPGDNLSTTSIHPPVKKRPISHLDQLLKLQEERMKKY